MDLFAPPPKLTREQFNSQRLTLVPVVGDEFSPELRSDWDYVLAAPTSKFLYDSLYVVDLGGFPCIKRCQSKGAGLVAMMNDNPVTAKRRRTAPTTCH
jgi:hypothetical protein